MCPLVTLQGARNRKRLVTYGARKEAFSSMGPVVYL